MMQRARPRNFHKFSRDKSPALSDTVASFKKVQCKRGHSLMRRTECSWEKLQKRQIQTHTPDKRQPKKGNTDYFTGRTEVNQRSTPFRQNVKSRSNQNSKSKFYQRGRPFFQQRAHQKIDEDVKYVGKINKDTFHVESRPTSHFKRAMRIGNVNNHRNSAELKHLKKEKKQPVTAETYQIDKFVNRKSKSIKSIINHRKKVEELSSSKLSPEETYQVDCFRKEQKSQPKKEEGLCAMKILSKSKEEFSTLSSLHNSALPLFSKKCSIISNGENISHKINLHLEVLGELAEYSKQLLETYEDSSEWEELAFLVYKKYYMERVKVVRALRGIGMSPFHLSVCPLLDEELTSFRKKLQGIKLAKEIEGKNKTVMNSLRSFYNNIIEKSGNHINLEERNDFTQQIFKDMQIEINLLKQLRGSEAEKRLAKVYRCVFLIAELEGNPVISYEESLDADDFGSYLRKASHLFHQCFIL